MSLCKRVSVMTMTQSKILLRSFQCQWSMVPTFKNSKSIMTNWSIIQSTQTSQGQDSKLQSETIEFTTPIVLHHLVQELRCSTLQVSQFTTVEASNTSHPTDIKSTKLLLLHHTMYKWSKILEHIMNIHLGMLRLPTLSNTTTILKPITFMMLPQSVNSMAVHHLSIELATSLKSPLDLPVWSQLGIDQDLEISAEKILKEFMVKKPTTERLQIQIASLRVTSCHSTLRLDKLAHLIL
jgi:hypothetical protein